MSEAKEAKEGDGKAKKKGGKLPIILAVVLVLGGGGFFMMKKPGGKKEAPKIEMGTGDASLIELEEKLFNLADKATYLRCTLAFQLKKGFDGSHVTKDVQAGIEDAVFDVMTSKRPDEFFGGVAKMKAVRREIAAAVNKVLAAHDHSAEHAEEGHEKKDEKGKKKAEGESHGDAKEPTEPEHPDWDSDTGPVLKVYVKALALQ